MPRRERAPAGQAPTGERPEGGRAAGAPGGFRSGYVAIAGRPNVGKSTLLNRVVGQEVAIVTRRPQTTRNRIVGVKHLPGAQLVLVDTPGAHEPRNQLGRVMAREIDRALGETDAVLLVVEPRAGIAPEEQHVLDQARGRPAVLAINKIDAVRDKREVLPVIDEWRGRHGFCDIVPISALTGDGVERLERALAALLPPGPPYFPPDAVTDRIERFLASEKVREQAMIQLGEEVPYAVAVTVESFEDRPQGDVRIEATVHVERESQRKIAIGAGGARIREIGTRARAEIARLVGRPVHLRLWVKVAPKWSRDAEALRRLGYE